jgi:hypothetical protein
MLPPQATSQSVSDDGQRKRFPNIRHDFYLARRVARVHSVLSIRPDIFKFYWLKAVNSLKEKDNKRHPNLQISTRQRDTSGIGRRCRDVGREVRTCLILISRGRKEEKETNY